VNDSAPMRMAFTIISRGKWAGGYNYLCNLFAALHAHCPGVLTPVVFAGKGDDADDLAYLGKIPGVEAVQSTAFDRTPIRLAEALLLGRDHAAVAEFRRNRIDAVFESARFFGRHLPIPALAWIPDLQHRSLPHLFPTTVRWRRELGFRAQIASGRKVMLSSASAQRDFLKAYPDAQGRIAVVRFAMQPAAALLTSDPLQVARSYGLPASYFYLPNQFWPHKNHLVVVDALQILSKQGIRPAVAVSGSKYETRAADYFEAVMGKVSDFRLDNSFRYLGVIPLEHVYALLRGALALVNPSRFEGWSTTVEEAKSFGVPLILSDIDVHREQADDNALFFPVDEPATLARHLASLMSSAPVVRELLPNAEGPVRRFAEDFVATARSLLR
jgi:glycosyltransferase involved in cell wall biosynthesis